MRSMIVVLQVTDIDHAKAVYETVGWRCDADVMQDGYRMVQFAPPELDISIVLTGPTTDVPDTRSLTAWEIESPETAWSWWPPVADPPPTAWP